MSESLDKLQHKMHSASELESVVRTMKAIAAGNISQYENAVRSLDDYFRTVQLGLTACLVNHVVAPIWTTQKNKTNIIIVFGSDQGLVGQFNQHMMAYTKRHVDGPNTLLWTVGERINGLFAEDQLNCNRRFNLPHSIDGITTLVSEILQQLDKYIEQHQIGDVYLFNHRPKSNASYQPVSQRLLPLDKFWQQQLSNSRWPTNNIPQLVNAANTTFLALLREYLFVSLYKACAESLASENASRLAAMQRAEKNIEQLQDDLHRTFHHLRQTGIDEELFDLVGGFEALQR